MIHRIFFLILAATHILSAVKEEHLRVEISTRTTRHIFEAVKERCESLSFEECSDDADIALEKKDYKLLSISLLALREYPENSKCKKLLAHTAAKAFEVLFLGEDLNGCCLAAAKCFDLGGDVILAKKYYLEAVKILEKSIALSNAVLGLAPSDKIQVIKNDIKLDQAAVDRINKKLEDVEQKLKKNLEAVAECFIDQVISLDLLDEIGGFL